MIFIKKAIRSIINNKRSYFACIWLITVGIMFFNVMGNISTELRITRDKYFSENKMADVFSTVSAISKNEEDRLLRIEGIKEVAFQNVVDARVLMDDVDKIITLRINSVDVSNKNPINAVNQTGNGFYADNDILISEAFLKANNLSVGDDIALILQGKQLDFQIRGTGESPQYVYTSKNQKEMLPDPRVFGIAYLEEKSMNNLLENQEFYNTVNFILEENYTFDDVKVALEDELSKFGLIQLLEQEDLPSVSMLNSRIDSIKVLSTIIPYVFIGLSIIVIYMMLKRVIEMDRAIIGTLKAFGYSNFKIISHYSFFGLFTGIIGGIVGSILGLFISSFAQIILKLFFNLPHAEFIDISLIVKGILIGISGGLLGAFMSARKITKLNPSDAMRPESPSESNFDILKYLPFLNYILDSGGFMAMRNITRNKFRSGFTIIGVVFAFGILSFIGSLPSIIDGIVTNQFTKVQLYDAKISYKRPVSYHQAIEDTYSIDGVTMVEGILEIPVNLSHDNLEVPMILSGIQSRSNLYKIYDDEKKISMEPSSSGIIVSSTLSEDLLLNKGDYINVKSSNLKEDKKLIVMDIVTQGLGSSCYIELNALCEIFEIKPSVNSVIVKTNDLSFLRNYLIDGKNIGLIEDKNESLQNFDRLLGFFNYIFAFLMVMGTVIAIAIIFNTAAISISERQREFTTLRVLGMQSSQVGKIMGFESWLLSIIGMAFGIPFTIFLKHGISKAIDLGTFKFPEYTPPYSYLVGLVGCTAAIFISNQASKIRIEEFNLVEVLKERD